MHRPISEVAYFREQQALQEQAAQLGLTGSAKVADHATITARMQRGALHIARLIEEGKHDEALVLMNTAYWEADVSQL